MILNCRESGQGPPVCLLHGLFGRLQNLAPLAHVLAGSFRVLSIDLRNHGASPHADGMAYPDLAMDVIDTLDAVGGLPATLLGHSMGGKVAMLAALRNPARVSRLIVADIAPIAYAHQNAGIAAALLALPLMPGMARRDADALLAQAIPDASVRAFLLQNLEFGPAPRWKIGLPAIAAGMGDIEGWPDLPADLAYPGPALFIRGEQSDYVPDAVIPAIRSRFAQARLEQIAGAGHWLHADRPDAFGRLVQTFLTQ